MIEGTCPCGRSRVLELHGRAGFDFIKLQGALLHRAEFDRVLARYPAVVRDYRVEASEVRTGDKYKGRVVLTLLTPELGPTETLKREMRDAIEKDLFVTPTQTLAQLVAQGLCMPLEVQCRTAPFDVRNKEYKLKKID
jgi:hypothetical protein